MRAQRPWFVASVAVALVACGASTSRSELSAGGGASSSTGTDGGAGAQDFFAAGASGEEAGASPAESNPANALAGTGGAAPELNPSGPTGGSAEPEDGDVPRGEAGAGGAPSAVSPSGTHLCSGADDCVGPVECRGRTSSKIRVCLQGCATDADCSPNHRCVLPTAPSAPDAAGCFLRCEDSPLICPYAFDCSDLSGDHEYTCLPRQW